MPYYLHASLTAEEQQSLSAFLSMPKFTGAPDAPLQRLLELGFVSQRVDGLILSGLGHARLQLGMVRARRENPPGGNQPGNGTMQRRASSHSA